MGGQLAMAQRPVPSKVTLTWEPPAHKPLTDLPFKWIHSCWVSVGEGSGLWSLQRLAFVEPCDVSGLEVKMQMVTSDIVVGHGKPLTGGVASVSFPAHLFSESRQWRGRVGDYFSLLLSHISSRDVLKSPYLCGHTMYLWLPLNSNLKRSLLYIFNNSILMYVNIYECILIYMNIY